MRRYVAIWELPAKSARNHGDRFDWLSMSPSSVLQFSNLSDQELTKVELPVRDEPLNQDPHFVAIKPPERLARIERRLVQPDRRRHHCH